MVSAVNPLVLIGTYTEPQESKSEGVYVYRMNSSTGELTFQTLVKGMPNISFMTMHPHSGLIYAVNETEEFDGKPGGGVSVISMNHTEHFSVWHQQSSAGANPAYISIDRTGRFALVANYKAGNIAMFPIQADGRLQPASDVVQHTGSSAHPERQTAAHPHCLVPDPENRFAFAADLGADKLILYRMDLEAGKLHKHAEVAVEARSGPRHILFDSRGRYYVLNELNSTVILYDFDPDTGSLAHRQTVSTLPELFSERNLCGDFRFSLDEKHLYVSNRGHDSLVCFKVEAESGELTYQSHIASNGHEPRILALDPSGRFMVAVHQKSHNAVVFRVDPFTGNLSPTGYEVTLDMPVHVLFA